MQNDLISRKVVMEYLQEQQANVIIEKHKNGFVSQEVCDGMLSAIDAFINFIVQCPIDYNVEKVVTEMEEYEYTHLIEHNGENMKHCVEHGNCDGEDCLLCVWNKAKQIVRNGGKE